MAPIGPVERNTPRQLGLPSFWKTPCYFCVHESHSYFGLLWRFFLLFALVAVTFEKYNMSINATLLTGFLLLIIFGLLTSRIALIYPRVSIGQKFSLNYCWRASRGQMFKLYFGNICAIAPLLLLHNIFLTIAKTMLKYPGQFGPAVVIETVSLVPLFGAFAVAAGFLSLSYKALGGVDNGMGNALGNQMVSAVAKIKPPVTAILSKKRTSQPQPQSRRPFLQQATPSPSPPRGKTKSSNTGAVLLAGLVGVAIIAARIFSENEPPKQTTFPKLTTSAKQVQDLSTKTDRHVCNLALGPSKTDWSTESQYSDYVQEAKDRGRYVAECRRILDLEPTLATAATQPAPTKSDWYTFPEADLPYAGTPSEEYPKHIFLGVDRDRGTLRPYITLVTKSLCGEDSHVRVQDVTGLLSWKITREGSNTWLLPRNFIRDKLIQAIKQKHSLRVLTEDECGSYTTTFSLKGSARAINQLSPQSTQSAFVTLRFPFEVSMDVPRDWWVLNDTMNRLIRTSRDAVLDLRGIPTQGDEEIVLIAANSWPPSTYAALRVTRVRPPLGDPNEFRQLSKADLQQLKNYNEAELKQILALQGLNYLKTIDVGIEEIGGWPAFVFSYARSGPKGPVVVYLIQITRKSDFLRINLSYRQAEATLWRPVIALIKKSIQAR